VEANKGEWESELLTRLYVLTSVWPASKSLYQVWQAISNPLGRRHCNCCLWHRKTNYFVFI